MNLWVFVSTLLLFFPGSLAVESERELKFTTNLQDSIKRSLSVLGGSGESRSLGEVCDAFTQGFNSEMEQNGPSLDCTCNDGASTPTNVKILFECTLKNDYCEGTGSEKMCVENGSKIVDMNLNADSTGSMSGSLKMCMKYATGTAVTSLVGHTVCVGYDLSSLATNSFSSCTFSFTAFNACNCAICNDSAGVSTGIAVTCDQIAITDCAGNVGGNTDVVGSIGSIGKVLEENPGTLPPPTSASSTLIVSSLVGSALLGLSLTL